MGNAPFFQEALLDCPGQGLEVSALVPKAPPFPTSPPPHPPPLAFPSLKGNLEPMTGVSGPQSPAAPGELQGRRQCWDLGAGASVPAGLASRSCWRCHSYRASLLFSPLPNPTNPSPSDQALPGTEAPGYHGNGFQAPAAASLIGWLSQRAKVTPGVTFRSRSWVSSGPPRAWKGMSCVEF